MKLSEYQGEDAIDLLADILEPLTDIAADEGLKKAVKESRNRLQIAQYLLKNHKKEIIAILARIDGVPTADYKCTVFSLTNKVLEIANDSNVSELFQSQGQKMGAESSGSATGITEEGETE